MLVDSSVATNMAPHTLPLSNLKKEIAETSQTLYNQILPSGLIRMFSFQFWDQKCAICYFEECCISVQPKRKTRAALFSKSDNVIGSQGSTHEMGTERS